MKGVGSVTLRERQILNWIEENPMITQEELARKAGITRSSVAVHISNLMKKGHIAGRGYVLSGSAYVAVVGGVNIDIGGQPFRPLIPQDSNPGRVSVSLGGVGRNIAHKQSMKSGCRPRNRHQPCQKSRRNVHVDVPVSKRCGWRYGTGCIGYGNL